MMKISASQDETWLLCPRKWWFGYPKRLPQLPKSSTDFGTALHSVTERWRKADDTGRDPATGQPVDLYPEGWDSVEGRKLPAAHADQIKALVQKAIESGVLERRQGRQVEKWFERPIIPGVKVVGKIDCLAPGMVEDDKSTSDLKWAKNEKRDSDNYLGASPQMLLYGHELTEADPHLQTLNLRHNYYCKKTDKPRVRPVSVTVTREEVEANWKRLQAQAELMRTLSLHGPAVNEWQNVPGPSKKDACRAFGGCPFETICGRTETPAQYTERVQRQIEHHVFSPEVTTWDEAWDRLQKPTLGTDKDSMSVLDKLHKPAPAGASTPGPAVNGAIAPATPATEAPATTTATADIPPWAMAGCPACKGAGFNRNGDPCRICDSKQKAAGNVTSEAYVIEKDGLGSVIWEAKDGSGGGQAQLSEPAPAPVADAPRVEVAAPQETAPAPQETAPAAQADMQPAVSPLDNVMAQKPEAPPPAASPAAQAEDPLKAVKKVNDEATKEAVQQDQGSKPKGEAPAGGLIVDPSILDKKVETRGRKKTGFFLYIDCAPIGVKTLSADTVFARLCSDIAEEAKKPSYYDLDPFKRRELFARNMTPERVEELLNKEHVVARNPQGSPDFKAFIDALVAVSKEGRVVQGLS